MLTSKMYKLEKTVHSYKSDDITNVDEQTLNICNLANVRISSVEELDYIKGAIAIPYTDMLKHIDFYYDTMMDEGGELFWISDLSKQYSLSSDLVVKRFHNVSKLSSSLIYKKRMMEFYGIDEEEKKLIKKR